MIYKSILQTSAELIAHFNSIDQMCFTTEEAARLLETASKQAVSQLLTDMTKRGLLLKLKHGLYCLVPYEQDPNSFMPDWHLLAKYLVGDANYYVGYYSAMQIHSLITQPALKEQIVVDKQIKPSTLKIRGIPFQFITHNKAHFFGRKPTWIDGFNKVQCSDLEKTFIDALFKPEYAGGITEIAKAIYKSREKMDFKKLEKYAYEFDSLAVSKRLGYILDLLKLQIPIVKSLKNLPTKSYFLLDPSRPKTGKRISSWNIQQNIDDQSLLSPIYS